MIKLGVINTVDNFMKVVLSIHQEWAPGHTIKLKVLLRENVWTTNFSSRCLSAGWKKIPTLFSVQKLHIDLFLFRKVMLWKFNARHLLILLA